MNSGNCFIFDPTYFRAYFPQFGDERIYSPAVLQQYWNWATFYVENKKFPCSRLSGVSRLHALNLMTAHLALVNTLAGNDDSPGIVTSATVGHVDVGLEPPPIPNQWQWWLGTTSYGQQLLALLQAKSVGGGYYGGAPVITAFRY
jgi:hypothetical protein